MAAAKRKRRRRRLTSRSGPYAEHYAGLFRELEQKEGPLDREIVGAIVGFSGGGPVAMSKNEKKGIYVTCELSLYPEQKTSAEGLKFELLSLGDFDMLDCRVLFTAIGNLSMDEELGHDHTVQVGDVLKDGPPQVRLQLFSECEIGGQKLGVYRVLPEKGE